MSSALQKNLRQQLIDKKISAHALEKKAGLKPSAIQNILQGKSKRPGADLLIAVSRELGCSVEDLVEQRDSVTSKVSAPSLSQNWDPDLYMDSLKTVQSILDVKEMEMKKDEILKIVEEVYYYSLKGNQNKADQRFAEWLISPGF